MGERVGKHEGLNSCEQYHTQATQLILLLPEELHRLLNALFQAYLGLPSQYLLGLRTIKVGQVDIARAFGRSHDLRLIAGNFC
jgi:hypothetical protein